MISTTNRASAGESGDVGFFLGEGPGVKFLLLLTVGVWGGLGEGYHLQIGCVLLAESRLGFGCSWEEVEFRRKLESVMPGSESWS